MPEQPAQNRPWLIAAWPGMGNVSLIAAGYLIRELGMTPVQELPPEGNFDVMEIEAREGLVAPAVLPRGIFSRARKPISPQDLIVFIGEAQPIIGNLAYAHRLLDAAKEFDVERIVTFASLAATIHPAQDPKVCCVATDLPTLEELRKVEVNPIDDGQIGGMNGLLLGAAAARGLSGLCLLAEIPYFAVRVPNPKAARAALSVLTVLTHIDISMDGLNRQAAIIDRLLIEAMERMPDQAAEPQEEEFKPFSPVQHEMSETSEAMLDPASRERIEQMFAQARQNLDEAVKLKAELDRLGVFKQYEGRFLDLFRKAI